MARVVIAGCGYVGTALGARLAARGHEVWGVRRLVPRDGAFGWIACDLRDPELGSRLPRPIDVAFYTAAADGATDELYRAAYVDGLRAFVGALAALPEPPRRLLFTSSTSVYAQRDGEWVDERSPTEPERFTGRRMLEGERLVLEAPFGGVVLRLGGIYGPRRARLVRRVREGTARVSPGPTRWANRIHVADCAGALEHLMSLERPERLYLGVDAEPADPDTVVRWIAARLGLDPPPVSEDREARLSEGAGKRCDSSRLTSSGYALAYPTFREGYGAILDG